MDGNCGVNVVITVGLMLMIIGNNCWCGNNWGVDVMMIVGILTWLTLPQQSCSPLQT